jgi:hypothetical protein
VNHVELWKFSVKSPYVASGAVQMHSANVAAPAHRPATRREAHASRNALASEKA